MDGSVNLSATNLILVIDDDPTQRILCREALEVRGYQVEEADCGEAGLEMARTLRPNLILLDVMMPGMDGYEVCRQIRADKELGRTPVIIMTALEDLEAIETGFQAGATDFLGKPIVWPLLGYRLLFALRAAQMESDLVDARDKAEQASRAKSLLLANMGHELRTPLNAIIGFSSHLRDQGVSDGWKNHEIEFLNDIHFSGHRLLSTVNDVLEMANLEAGQVELDERKIDLKRLFNDLAKKFADQAAEKSLTLDMSGTASSPAILGDHDALVRVFSNLIQNALSFTEQGGVYIGAVCRDSGELEISVTDTGIGMTPEQVEAIYQPFQQADNSLARKHEGSGLGVSITRALIKLHGGHLDIKSEPETGTSATVRLPAERVIESDQPADPKLSPTE